jgi:hypothetical protein
VTPDEIRACEIDPSGKDDTPYIESLRFTMLREIAAQLAEFNQRENRGVEETHQYLWNSGWRPKP